MNPKNAFILPVKGMGKGVHQYVFQVDGSFFEHREGAPVDSCNITVEVEADRRENMIVMQFSIEGIVDSPCDRCLADINLPIHGEQQLIVKFKEEESVEDDEVLILHPETSELGLADILYEFICLSIPMVKVYDCEEEEEPPCDYDTIDRLESEEDDDEDDTDPMWEELKKKLS